MIEKEDEVLDDNRATDESEDIAEILIGCTIMARLVGAYFFGLLEARVPPESALELALAFQSALIRKLQ